MCDTINVHGGKVKPNHKRKKELSYQCVALCAKVTPKDLPWCKGCVRMNTRAAEASSLVYL
jgi:hypothetical protein